MAKLKNSGRADSQKLKSALHGGCFLMSMVLLVVYTTYVVSFSKLALRRSNQAAPSPAATAEEKMATSHQTYATSYQMPKLQSSNPFCDSSNRRNEYCEMEGDIRIHGNSSTISFVVHPNTNASKLQESWKFKPHPRKGDARAMARVTEMSVKTLLNNDAPRCAVHSSVPAIVFSTGGYMGNFFHDFTDILIPIFTTSQQFNREVQFLISEILPWWNDKYKKLLQPLTNYEIIDFNQDQTVRCYPHVIVGLKYHKEMSIEPSTSPYGLTMVDFGRYVRRSLKLERDTAIKLGPNQDKKPRILIVARKWTRRFANVDEIVKKVEEMGFEAVVAEAKYNDVAEFAQIVNSCDVMMGVHGAGLTNLVFLPTNAVVIQVIPLGGLEGISWIDFGQGTINMKMHYLQYSISLEESTLTEQYPKSDPVLSDTKEAYRKHGWDHMIDLYFAKQGVKLDMARFGSTLLHALELLSQK